MKTTLRYAVLAVAAATSACSGSTSSNGVPVAVATAPDTQQSNAAQASFTLTIPRSAASAARMKRDKRTRHYVSFGTLGVTVAVYQTDTNPANAVVTSYDVSPSSKLCTSAMDDGQQCTLAIPAPAGNDTFVVNAYETTPSQGFAAGSRLSNGSTTATIVAGQTNAISVVLAEIVSSVVFQPPRRIPLGNQETNAPLAIGIYDAAGFDEADTADATPFAAPIHLAYTEFGNGNGQLVHTSFSVNGGFPVAFVTIAKPSDADAVTLNYDGQAPVGYYATIDATLPNVSSATIGSGQVDPLFLTSTSPLFNGGVNFTAAGQSATIALNLADLGDGAFPVTITSSNANTSMPCTSIASVTAPTSGSTPTVTISALGGAGSCTIGISLAQQFSGGFDATIGETELVSIPVTSSI